MIFLASSIVFVLDRLTKALAASYMSYGQSIKVLPGIFHITFVLNTGTAFGLFKGQNLFFISVSIIIIIAILVYAFIVKIPHLAARLALGLILGGAAGNLFDRIRFGNVIDFLDFRIWPIFNIADSAITIGMLILVWIILRRRCTP